MGSRLSLPPISTERKVRNSKTHFAVLTLYCVYCIQYQYRTPVCVWFCTEKLRTKNTEHWVLNSLINAN